MYDFLILSYFGFLNNLNITIQIFCQLTMRKGFNQPTHNNGIIATFKI